MNTNPDSTIMDNTESKIVTVVAPNSPLSDAVRLRLALQEHAQGVAQKNPIKIRENLLVIRKLGGKPKVETEQF